MSRFNPAFGVHTGVAASSPAPSVPREVSLGARTFSNSLALSGGDLLSIGVSLLIAETVDFWALGGTFGVPFWAAYLVVLWLAGASLLRLLPGWGLGPVEELRRVTTLVVAVFGTLGIMMLYGAALASLYTADTGVGLHDSLPDLLVLGVAGVASAITLPLMRTWVRRALNESGRWGIPAIVFGQEAARDRVAHLLETEAGMGYTPVLRGELSSLETAMPPSRQAPPSVAVLALEGLDRARVSQLLEGPLAAYRTVIVVPDLMMSPCLWVQPRDLRGVLGLEITRNLTSVSARLTKRTMDVALVLATAVLWLPVCLALAALIWLEDRRSPLFLQERVGSNGRSFQTFKFRTMRTDAEEVLRRYLDADPALRAEWEAHYKLRVDPRITRVGYVLRGLSLDELPQLLNVLIGDMSLVGPRPLPSYHHDALSSAARSLRERVRPGITGLWQVSGRSDIGNEGMELWDPYYVRNWSLWLDAVILVRTARAVLARSGAY